jgi:oligoendopeptidase F
MHSWYFSARNNPYMQYNYTIFEAEVASTFNEELVFEYLLKNARGRNSMKRISACDACRTTSSPHSTARRCSPNTNSRRTSLLNQGRRFPQKCSAQDVPLVSLNSTSVRKCISKTNSDMEGLRIPHFYNAFYVYKYSYGHFRLACACKKGDNRAERQNATTILRS